MQNKYVCCPYCFDPTGKQNISPLTLNVSSRFILFLIITIILTIQDISKFYFLYSIDHRLLLNLTEIIFYKSKLITKT